MCVAIIVKNHLVCFLTNYEQTGPVPLDILCPTACPPSPGAEKVQRGDSTLTRRDTLQQAPCVTGPRIRLFFSFLVRGWRRQRGRA